MMRASRGVLLITILARPFFKAAPAVSAFLAPPPPAARLGPTTITTTTTWRVSPIESSDACKKHVTMFPSNRGNTNKEHHGGAGGGAPEPTGLRRRPSLSLGARDANKNATRKGGHASIPSSSDGVRDARPPIDDAFVVEGLRGGAIKPKNRLLIDHVEDAWEDISSSLVVISMPFFHLARLGFGLSLLFYGMAFRTFAFQVIVFRLAGWKKVQKSTGELATNYRDARKSIRAVADAAATAEEDFIEGNELKAARETMIEEKKKLLSDGYLSEEETKYFMNKYKAELSKIIDEQEQFQSARSSVSALRTAVDPDDVRSSMTDLYSGLVTCFTASTLQTAGQITLGLHIGNLLKTHILDLFGAILDPIGYGLDLDKYYDSENIPYMGKANAMDGSQNLALTIFCYSVVFVVFLRVHPSIALKASMVYYGARVVTDYVILATNPALKELGQKTIGHTPWSAAIHAALSLLGFYFHHNALHTAEVVDGLNPLAVGPGLDGLVEPCVRFFVSISEVLSQIDFFKCQFVEDPVELVKNVWDS